MISTVFDIGLRRLLHNKVELLLTFVVPICFFSIFALIFGRGMGTTPKVKAVLVNESNRADAKEIVQAIRDSEGLRIMQGEDDVLDRQTAEQRVRNGTVTMAIIVRDKDDAVSAELLADTSDKVAPQIVSALVTRSILAHQSYAADDDLSLFAANLARTGPTDAMPVDAAPLPSNSSPVIDSIAAKPAVTPIISQPNINIVDVMQAGKSNPVVSMYAAGIAVMFLLFGATNGGGALLEERENQTLERLLSTRLTMHELLMGKWLYQTVIGILQVLTMFLWAQLVFGVDLINHLNGFAVMTTVTAAAASAFGLFLATLCKSRGQLNGLSVIVILTMSALGGSMVPRYVMSEQMREAGLWTFNAWALDGYDKVFWRDLPIDTLIPQVTVLAASTLAFLIIARLLAVRWETQ